MNSKTDILVVGAGPTGLTAAIELARRGIAIRVVEKRTEPSNTSKALVVHARTLEQLDMIGIADELVQKGYTSPGIDFSASADKPLRADMHKLAGETRFPFILILPQAETEAALERRLEKGGVKVERGSTLKSLRIEGDRVVALVEREGSASEEIATRYIVGADGPHSTVREQLGIKFEGSPYGWTAFLGDVTMKGHKAEGGTEQHSSDRGLAFIVPFEDGSHRIVTIDNKYREGPQRRDLELGELQESVSAILGKSVELSEPKWLTRWGSDLRLAETYGRGRAFLLGDAAHTHSPAGGQGMNTGIQDAFGLGWRLSMAAKGDAGASLLEEWRAERHAQGRRVLRTSDLLLRSLLLRRPLWRRARELLFKALIPLPPVQRSLAMNLSGLGVHYGAPNSWVGARAPDLKLANAQHTPVRLYERLRSGKPILLIYVDPKEAGPGRATISGLIEIANRRGVEPVVVLRNGVAAHHPFDGAETLVDYCGDFETRLGASHPRQLLVRPDGYFGSDLAGLDGFDESWRAWILGEPIELDATRQHAAVRAQSRTYLLAGLFALSGAMKLVGTARMKSMFDGYGLPHGFMRLVGLWEIAGAATIATKRTQTEGAASLALLSAGAAATHVKAREPLKLLNALALLALAASVVMATRRRK